jgi:acetolactate synthase-1/2/3 large subunit
MPAQRELGFTRYDRMVEALGGFGDFVEKPDDIKPALERAREKAFAAKKPALVNIIADPAAQATTDTGFGGGYD